MVDNVHHLTVTTAGTSAAGYPAFSLYVNGHLVASDVSVTADYTAGQWNTFSFSYQSASANDDIKIVYANDFQDAGTAADRNLFVNSLSVDGKTFEAALIPGAALSLAPDAGYTSAAMYANGTLDFNTSDFHAGTAGPLKYLGIAYSGAEFSDTQLSDWHQAVSFPTNNDIDYYVSKGLNTLRLPIAWERLQPVKDGPLDQSYLAKIQSVVSYAASKGVSVVVDLHNSGQAYGSVVGGPTVTNADFGDLWGKLASALKSDGNIMFGIMNEPHVQSPTDWVASANVAISAIRAAGASQTILVPGAAWDSAATWLTSGNASALSSVADPLNNVAFEVHTYLDVGSTGTVATAVSSSIGEERLTAVTQWAEATGAKLFLGEIGAASDTTSLDALNGALAYMQDHSDVWLGGTYWAAGNTNFFSIDPVAGVDRPQMGVLGAYAPNAASGAVISSYTNGGTTYYSNGSVETRQYASDGSLSLKTLVESDGTKIVTTYNITGQAYTTQLSVTNASGAPVSLERFHADGTLAFTKVVDQATGSVTSDQYSTSGVLATRTVTRADGTVDYLSFAADGVTLARDVISYADGSKEAYMYGITGAAYISQHEVYDASRTLTKLERLQANGTPLLIKTIDPVSGVVTSDQYRTTGVLNTRTIVQTSGASEIKTFDASGTLVIRDVLMGADGSKTAFTYDIAGQAYSSQHEVYDPAGIMTRLEQFRTDGSLFFTKLLDTGTGTTVSSHYGQGGTISSESIVQSNGTIETVTFDPVTHAIVRDVVNYTDGSVVTLFVGGEDPSRFLGAAGLHVVNGRVGHDAMVGGTGDDVFLVTDPAATVKEAVAGGTDLVRTTLASYALPANVEWLTFVGTGPAHLSGNALDNVIRGGAGNDVLVGGDGNDILIGGLGSDTLTGGAGADIFRYLAFADSASAPDTITDFTSGTDKLDFSLLSLGGDTITIHSDTAHTLVDITDPHAGTVFSVAVNGAQAVHVGDILVSGPVTINELDAAGRLNATLVATDRPVFALPATATDLTYIGTGHSTLTGNALGNTIVGGDAGNHILGGLGNDTIIGGNGGDSLAGNQGDDVIQGGAGDDAIWGGQNDDVLHGGGGADRIAGNLGNDIIHGDDGNDTIWGGQDDDILYGDAGNDILFGNLGADTLIGGAGADRLTGGGGADTFVFTAISESTVAGPDTITDFQTGIDHLSLETLWTGASDRLIIQQNADGAAVEIDLGGNGTIDLLINVTGRIAASDILWPGQIGVTTANAVSLHDMLVTDPSFDAHLHAGAGGILAEA